MDYRYLKAFIYTAHYASFSRAAKELNIAQSAVSRQIKLLEESVGKELIIRSSKKVLLTHKGRELFMAASNFDKVAMDIFQKEDSRPINIGILHGLLKHWFYLMAIKFYKKHNRNMHIQIAKVGELREGIENGKFDIVFSTENIQTELISSLKLFNENFVLISKDEINRKKLHEYRWVVYGQDDKLYNVSKRKSSQIVSVDSLSTILKLVRNQVGIAVVPDHALKKSENLKVYELGNQIQSCEVFMTTLNYKSMPAHLKELTTLVSKSLEN